MCLIVFGLHAHPRYPLVVAANRDEFVARPSEPAGFWPGHDGLLAGRDLAAGGTWMGVTRSGRFAALTNVRDPRAFDPSAPSRGELVVRFLAGAEEPVAHLRRLAAEGSRRNGFNLLAAAGGRLAWFSNAGGEPREVEAGVHAVSNALLDTPVAEGAPVGRAASPGYSGGRTRSTPRSSSPSSPTGSRRRTGSFPTPASASPPSELLSSPFIAAPGYGTRGSTLLLVTSTGRATFLERRFDEAFREVGHDPVRARFPGLGPTRKGLLTPVLRTGFKTPESGPLKG